MDLSTLLVLRNEHKIPEFIHVVTSLNPYIEDDKMYHIRVKYVLRTDVLIIIANSLIALTTCHIYSIKSDLSVLTHLILTTTL